MPATTTSPPWIPGPGSILVAPNTTPAWTQLFAHAVGLVTDMGSILAHGSIVAREFGIPAVLGVGNGTVRQLPAAWHRPLVPDAPCNQARQGSLNRVFMSFPSTTTRSCSSAQLVRVSRETGNLVQNEVAEMLLLSYIDIR